MLHKITLEGVGPSNHLEATFAERLNLITGDNGLGKSFLLEVAWWALTRTWPHKNRPALPRQNARKARIDTEVFGSGKKAVSRKIPFDFAKQKWIQPQARPQLPGLVLFAQVDGGFAVWDPARNYWKDEDGERPSAFLFDSEQVWTGLQEGGQWRCNGLYRDWASWQRESGNEAFGQLKLALEKLSPPGETLRPGLLQRISTEDSQDYPTIHMPYGVDVPLIHASAAIRRILALAYLLIWAWREHLRAAELRREAPTKRIILLIDEVEAHLHPAWQKKILPSLLHVVEALTGAGSGPEIQVICSTHSPLVCVSMESYFDGERDQLFDLDLDPLNGVRLEAVPFQKMGTGENWLLSRHFDLKTSYSVEAEKVLATAAKLVEEGTKNPASIKKAEFLRVDKELRTVLTELDPSWVRWRTIGEKRGWLG